ncbi:hypothetical protein COCNU_scaffold032591G000040 [Cocos nucifera]|nr:hypothetical protein [Cocos nucifera]
MRAVVSRIKTELAAKPRPSLALKSLGSLFSHHHHYDNPPKKEKKNSYILDPDLPDIWSPPNSTPPLSQTQVDFEFIPTIIDGKSIAEEIMSGIAKEVCQMKDSISKVPGLAVILVGQRRDSQTYVPYEIKACQKVGIRSLTAELPHDYPEDEVVNIVSGFNEDPSVHGILVQQPLPQDPSSEHGYYLTGDVCYEEALQMVSDITPVPGGGGPITIAMLLSNMLESANKHMD